jgi:hypothetical protein
MSSVDRIMLCGDWHGNTRHGIKMIGLAEELGLRKIIQLGDFGIWTHDESGVKYLDILNEALRLRGIKIYFVPGNHENWDHIAWWMENHPRTNAGHVYVRSHILMVPKFLAWTWNDKRFAGVGGATSIDRKYRTPGTSWWAGEQLTDDDVRTISYTPGMHDIDYLLTHDAPTTVPHPQLKVDLDSQTHRQRMDEVGKMLRPRQWFHGHYHKYMPYYPFPMYDAFSHVWGLDMDGEYYSWGVLDTNTDVFTPGPEVDRNNP